MEPKESEEAKEEAKEEANTDVEIEAAEDAKETIEEPIAEAEAEHEKISVYETRISQLEERLASQEALYTDLQLAVEAKAPGEHSHPLPGHVQTISDALAEMDAEERTPEHSHFLYRKVSR